MIAYVRLRLTSTSRAIGYAVTPSVTLFGCDQKSESLRSLGHFYISYIYEYKCLARELEWISLSLATCTSYQLKE